MNFWTSDLFFSLPRINFARINFALAAERFRGRSLVEPKWRIWEGKFVKVGRTLWNIYIYSTFVLQRRISFGFDSFLMIKSNRRKNADIFFRNIQFRLLMNLSSSVSVEPRTSRFRDETRLSVPQFVITLHVIALSVQRRDGTKSESSPEVELPDFGARSNLDTAQSGGHRSRERSCRRRFSLPRNGLASR